MSPPEQPTLSEIKAEKEQHISWDTDCNLFQFTSALEAVCIVYDEIQQDTLSHATPFIRQDLDYPFGKNADSVSLQANCVSVLLLLLHIKTYSNCCCSISDNTRIFFLLLFTDNPAVEQITR